MKAGNIIKNKKLRVLYKQWIFIVIIIRYLLCIPLILFCYFLNMLGMGRIGQDMLLAKGAKIWQLKQRIFLQTVRVKSFKDEEINLNSIEKVIAEKMKRNENILLMLNHLTSCDFVIANWLLHCSPNTKYFFKDSLKFIPIFYQLCSLCGFLKLRRNFTEDKENIKKWSNENKKVILVLFPEGTRRTTTAMESALKFCKENNIEPFKNVLMPRYKGFEVLTETKQFKTIFDVTIAYFHNKKEESPSVWDFLFTSKIFDLKLDYEFIDYSTFENTNKKEYLIEMFRKKDKRLLEQINKHKYA